MPGTVNKWRVRKYLQELKRHVRGRQAILLWDRLPAHRSGVVQDYIRSQKAWLKTEYLPAYAPELNPVEYLWAHLSGTALANLAAENLNAVRNQVRRTARRVHHRLNLGRGFLKHSGLF
jgi:transposase